MNAVLQDTPLEFREMLPGDIDRVMEIEIAAYKHPWTKAIFNDCLTAGYLGIVASSDGNEIGYAMLSIAAGEAHLLNLCIQPDYQGSGLGRQLLLYSISESERRKAETLFLEVRESNRVAQQLYLDNGFNQIGSRHHYYPNGQSREDALVFARHLFDGSDL